MCHPASILLLASLVAQVDAPAPPADLGAAENVLGEAGLSLFSNSYILAGEVEASQAAEAIRPVEERLAMIVDRLGLLEDRYNSDRRRADSLSRQAASLRDQARRIRSYPDGRDESVRRGEADRLDREADDLYREVETARRLMLDTEREAAPLQRQRDATAQEIRRMQAAYRALVAETLRRYAALAADPRIKSALRELNRGRQPKLALGPIDAYQQNVVKAALETLAALGYREDRGVFILAAEAEFVEQVGRADLLRREVGMHEQRLQDPPPSPAAIKGQAPPPSEAQARKTAELLADRRAQYDQRVPELRQMADAILARQQVLAQDVEVRDSLAEVNKVRRAKARVGTKAGFQVSLQKLEEMEAASRADGAP